MAEFTANQIEEIVSIIANEFSKQATPQETVQGVARGVTQYVGARYVPLFAEPLEWDSAREYEALTIVLHEGNSYTSRQYVPAGIDISNNSFWALTGNYNAQVEQYRKEVAKEVSRATAKETELDAAIKAETSRAQAAEEATNAEVAKNSTDIATNKQAIADEKTERMEDTETLTAQLAGTSESGLKDFIDNLYEIKIYRFNTVDEMTKYTKFKEGDIAVTKGYRKDGIGGAKYIITAEGNANEYDTFNVGNNLYAVLSENTVYPEMVGAYLEEGHDDAPCISYALSKYSNVHLSPSTYYIESTIEMPTGSELHGVNGNTRLTAVGDVTVISIPTDKSSFLIENVYINHDATANSANGINIANCYNSCIIRNTVFDNLGGTALQVGESYESSISQSLLIDNCLFYSLSKNSKVMAIFNRVYEMNLLNTKFLYRSVGDVSNITTPCIKLVRCYDANIQGCSFAHTSSHAIEVNYGLRFSRIISNTYENIGSENLITFDAGTADYPNSVNTIIVNNYYNAPNKINFQNQYYNTNNVLIGCYATMGRQNIIICPNIPSDVSMQSPGLMSYSSNSNLGVSVNRLKINAASGGLVIKDSASKEWLVKVSTNGELTVTENA